MTMNIIAIACVLVYGVLESLQNYRTHFLIDENGIRNLYSNKLIKASTITGIEFNEERITIHTTKFQNDLVIEVSSLESPDWEEVKNEISMLSK